VPGFAVSVVAEHIERADGPQLIVQVFTLFVDGEVVLFKVRRHEQLQRTNTELALTNDGGRNTTPTKKRREPIGGNLTLIQAGRKIPQRPLALVRLVDGLRRQLTFHQKIAQERGVRTPRHAALDIDLGFRQELQRVH
jgi:hypothetical protein